MKSLNLNLSPSWSHLDIVPSRATWNTRTERKTWTDQLVNAFPRNRNTIMTSIANGGAVTWTCTPPQFKPHDTCIYTNTCYPFTTRDPLEEKHRWRNERRGSTSPSKHREFRDTTLSRFIHWLKLVSTTLNRLCLWYIDNQFFVSFDDRVLSTSSTSK